MSRVTLSGMRPFRRASALLIAILAAIVVLCGPTARALGPSESGTPDRPSTHAEGVGSPETTLYGTVSLRDCDLDGVQGPSLCGGHRVFENPEAASGRRIRLNIVVLPALGGSGEGAGVAAVGGGNRGRATRGEADPTPLFWLHGGPGVGSTLAAGWLSRSPLRRDRDIVLVDLRGTGRSNPLPCGPPGTLADPQGYVGGAFEDERLYRRCRGELRRTADLRWYSTPASIDDLDEIRAAMGFDEINLYGASAGTRAALVYMRRHPASVRAAILEAVAPLSFRNPLHHARNAQHAMNRTLAECASDPACNGRFPDLAAKFQATLDRLDAVPAQVTLAHPLTGTSVTVELDRYAFAEGIRSMSYGTDGNRWLPLVIQSAFDGTYWPVVAEHLRDGPSLWADLKFGLLMSMTCTEDVARIDPDEVPRATAWTYLGDDRVRNQMAACSLWPRTVIASDYGDPVRSDVPTLLVSGTLDPVTPPRFGRAAARHLENALHLVIASAHGFGDDPCMGRLLVRFLARGSVRGLNTSCADRIELPPFYLEAPQGRESGWPGVPGADGPGSLVLPWPRLPRFQAVADR